MKDARFLPDGSARAVEGAQQQIADLTGRIQAAVDSEYRPRLAKAGTLKRLYLLQRIKREIRRRVKHEVEKIAPTGGLYMRR